MIIASAIQRKSDGKIWTAKRHNNCINQIVAETGQRPVGREDFIQGFVTDDRRFVNREEAWGIALANNQILNLQSPYSKDPSSSLSDEPALLSEDLW